MITKPWRESTSDQVRAGRSAFFCNTALSLPSNAAGNAVGSMPKSGELNSSKSRLPKFDPPPARVMAINANMRRLFGKACRNETFCVIVLVSTNLLTKTEVIEQGFCLRLKARAINEKQCSRWRGTGRSRCRSSRTCPSVIHSADVSKQ